ncbi:hypothetical protein IJG79_01265 [Candidatus Saccharibacteria bacterium]|nr:hypothetical protein [Candidatus Saccharibacteria bacterium]
MQNFLHLIQPVIDKLKKEWNATLKNFGIKQKEKPTMMVEQNSNYEINLVPDVKRQMIKAMRFRNIMLFICIVVVSFAGGVVVITASIWEGQNIAMSSQDSRMKLMSSKLNDFSSLSDFLTIQSQLNDLNTINANKKVLSRVFPILGVVLPAGPDKITLSELTVDLSNNLLRFDGQADAKVSPYIDYRVLESFTKGVALMKYDYGRYVTANDEDIPTRCIVETDADGNMLVEEEKTDNATNKYVYAYWLKGKKGCDPARDDYDENAEDGDATQSGTANGSLLQDLSVSETEDQEGDNESKEQKIREEFDQKIEKMNDYEKTLAYNQLNGGAKMQNIDVVKIYRSPKFSDWYKSGNLTEEGTITGVNHFASECITYSGVESGDTIKWTSSNNCMLSTSDVTVRDSSNGRDSGGNLVLRFNATITLDENVFLFVNKHMMAISPTSQNVTDSYRQVEGMFAERAADCADSDVVCTSATTGSSASSSSNTNSQDNTVTTQKPTTNNSSGSSNSSSSNSSNNSSSAFDPLKVGTSSENEEDE